MLYIVATPIGNYQDITLRARTVLAECDIVIGEEHRPASTLLKKLGLKQKEIYQLNEHSKEKDLKELVEICSSKNVALISDAGTPGFADPGADLVRACRNKNIPVTAIPGPSSLMAILSLSGQRIDEFIYRGLLPANREEREGAIKNLNLETRTIILLETPYRLGQTLTALADAMPNRRALVGLNLTQEDEAVCEGSLGELAKKLFETKAEPVILVYAKK